MNARLIVLACSAAMIVSAAWADSNSVGAETVEIDADACRQAEQYAPSADVEYKPGVDVAGNAVAPADLPGGQRIQMPKKFAIPVSIDLARRLNLPRGTYTDAYVGLITVDNGALSFNGQPLDDGTEADLAAACAQAKPAK